MPLLTPETVKRVMHDVHGYEITDDDAQRIANLAGPMLTNSRLLNSLGLAGIVPPFGYPALIADATRLSAKKR